MPRIARTVCAGIPHHVTQRGNRREQVFFTDDDRRVYLKWLQEYVGKHDIDVLAYCRMTNHAHLVVVPAAADGLHRALKPLHMRFAQRVNRARGWNGHVWQRRFEHISDWSAWLAEGDEDHSLEVLRRHADKGLPCGSTDFIETLEKVTERPLRYRPQGRPKKPGSEKGKRPF